MSNQLEERLRLLEIENAKQKEEIKTLQKNQSDLKRGINRGLWLIGGGLFTAGLSSLVTFLSKAVTQMKSAQNKEDKETSKHHFPEFILGAFVSGLLMLPYFL